jgi:hypothetical protein
MEKEDEPKTPTTPSEVNFDIKKFPGPMKCNELTIFRIEEMDEPTMTIRVSETRSMARSQTFSYLKDDEDLKSTSSFMPYLNMPKCAKSVVSMMSDRSECGSVVMGRIPFDGTLSKLI